MKNFVVYRSSAGSGKTYSLAVNYISIAIGKYAYQRDYYKKILAITFTNKAAKEMKERVLHYLMILSQENDIDNILQEVINKTNLSQNEIFTNSKKIYSHIIHNYSDLGIQTIDKFTYKIVKTFSSDLGVSRDFELELDSAKIIQPVVALLISKISNNNRSLSNLLVDFSLQKINDGNSNEIQSDLENFCKHLFIEGSDDLLVNNSVLIKDSIKVKDELFKAKEECLRQVSLLGQKVSQFFLENNLSQDHFIRGTFYNLFTKKLLSKKYEDWIPTESLITNINDGIWYKKTLDQESKLEIDQNQIVLKDFFDELLMLLKDYITLDAILKKIYPSLIINELIKEVATYKKEHNIQHISSFNRQIHELVTNQTSSFIFERLGERYSHFLIDEFQDTSLLQWQNLLPLITDSLDFGRSIVVGDGKQSIYRWRAGEVEQFLELPKIFKGKNLAYLSDWQAKLNNHYTVESLQENFRSKKEIINFNNEFFSKLKQVLPEELIGIYNHHNQSSTYADDGGYVHVELFEGIDYKKDVLVSIVDEINNLINESNYRYKDIAVLCNTHEDISEVAEHLSLSSIPIVSNEGLLISKSEKVRVVISFVKYLKNIDDDIAKASIITYLYSLDLFNEDIHVLNLGLHDDNIFMAMLKKINIDIDVYDLLQLSLYEMIVEIISCLNLKNDIYIDFFTDLVHNYSQKNLNNISDFLNWWDDVKGKKTITISEDLDAVKLMTIHKSKGLAFKIVFIPFNWESDSRVKREIWVENNDSISKGLQYSLINQNKNLALSHFKNQYEREKALLILDNLNKLYVASTRAVDSLYILSKSLNKNSGNSISLNSFLSHFSKEYPFILGEKTRLEKENILSDNIFYNDYTEKCKWKDILSLKNSSLEFWDVEDHNNKKDWGKLLHYALSKIYFIGQEDTVINDLYNQGKCSYVEKDKLHLEVNKLFSLPDIQVFFSDDWEVKTEKEILMPDGRTYIPDRLLIKDNKVVIVDYKTGEIDIKHNNQIINYADALTQMGYKNISKYLIYTSHTEKVHKI